MIDPRRVPSTSSTSTYARASVRALTYALAFGLALLTGAAPSATAADSEQEKARKKLADKDVDFTPKSWFWNVRTEEHGIVALFLKAGFDVNTQDDHGKTAVHEAASLDSPKMLQALLAAKADVHVKDKSQKTALWVAIDNIHKDAGKIVQALLTAGAKDDVNARDDWGNTVLHEAANDDNPEMVKLLLDAGADVNARDKRGETPLYRAADAMECKALPVLLARGADVKARFSHNKTALHEAVSGGYVRNVTAVLAAGAEIEAKDQSGHTALHDAAAYGRDAALPVLIQKGADVNARESQGATPLMLAAIGGEADAVRMLIQAKADVKAADSMGRTALLQAASMNPAMFKHMKDPKAETRQIVEDLLAAGADPNAKDKYQGETPLLAAAAQGHLDTVTLLLNAGAQADAKNGDGRTAVSIAAEKGHTEIVQALIAAKADVNIGDRTGKTALAYAKTEGYPEIEELLKGAGATEKPAKAASSGKAPEKKGTKKQ